MQLQRIMDSLALGELSQTSYVDSLTFGIKPEMYRNVINSVNLGLSELYTHFDIHEKEIFIQQQDGKTLYKLHPDYALTSDVVGTDKYIMDTEDNPFTGDILRINQAYAEDGESIPINDMEATGSVFIPDYATLQIPFPEGANVISLIYTAKANIIPLDTLDTSIELNVPDPLLNALNLYTAYRLMGARTDQESQSRSRILLQDYINEVGRMKELNLYNSSYTPTDIKLEMRGFV